MIKVDNITVKFNNEDLALFSNLSFSVKKGEHVCLEGCSGSGKTTILKVLQAYHEIEEGQIRINNKELNQDNISFIRESIIWIPQKFNLPIETGQKLVELLKLNTKIKSIHTYMQNLGLNYELIDKNFSELSEGQKQRLIISICLSMQRPIILLDEPNSALDTENTQKLINLLKSQENKTILSVSHSPVWLKNADRIIKI